MLTICSDDDSLFSSQDESTSVNELKSPAGYAQSFNDISRIPISPCDDDPLLLRCQLLANNSIPEVVRISFPGRSDEVQTLPRDLASDDECLELRREVTWLKLFPLVTVANGSISSSILYF